MTLYILENICYNKEETRGLSPVSEHTPPVFAKRGEKGERK